MLRGCWWFDWDWISSFENTFPDGMDVPHDATIVVKYMSDLVWVDSIAREFKLTCYVRSESDKKFNFTRVGIFKSVTGTRFVNGINNEVHDIRLILKPRSEDNLNIHVAKVNPLLHIWVEP